MALFNWATAIGNRMRKSYGSKSLLRSKSSHASALSAQMYDTSLNWWPSILPETWLIDKIISNMTTLFGNDSAWSPQGCLHVSGWQKDPRQNIWGIIKVTKLVALSYVLTKLETHYKSSLKLQYQEEVVKDTQDQGPVANRKPHWRLLPSTYRHLQVSKHPTHW